MCSFSGKMSVLSNFLYALYPKIFVCKCYITCGNVALFFAPQLCTQSEKSIKSLKFGIKPPDALKIQPQSSLKPRLELKIKFMNKFHFNYFSSFLFLLLL